MTAVAPFAIAVFMRLLLGNNRLTRSLISVTVLWFAANVLMAPYSADVRTDIMNLHTLLSLLWVMPEAGHLFESNICRLRRPHEITRLT
jgi:hypothetical protein